MTARTTVHGLQVATELHNFINEQVLPGTGVDAAAFWQGFDALVNDLAPKNAALLAERDRLQKELDTWHKAHPGPITNMAGYQQFLKQIGYLVEQPKDAKATTENVDAELAQIAGPQLVVPILNARYALNAANARWGSLYDALYGTDAISEEGGAEKSKGYNPVRGAKVIEFARNVLGDVMCTPALRECEIALYDINGERLDQSLRILSTINDNVNAGRARIFAYLGEENRRAALRGASFVINTVQIGGYEPCTVTDFEIPKKYGLRQTIADTLGIGGIMRALRTIPVLEEFTHDMEEVCPDALLLNYTNPMAMLTGYMQRYTKIRTVGLCHSVQVCSEKLLEKLGMEDKLEGATDYIAGINHMAWLLEVKDKDGNDLYPEITGAIVVVIAHDL